MVKDVDRERKRKRNVTTRKGVAVESFGDFVKRLSRSIGRHYHSNRSNVYSLKKFGTDQRGKMGDWGWVSELERKDLFRIDTYKRLGDKAEVSALANGIKEGMHFSKEGTGISFYVEKTALEKIIKRQ